MQEYRPVKEGKVREIYDVGEGIIMVATDRISAFDVRTALRIRVQCSRSCPVSGLNIPRMSCRTT